MKPKARREWLEWWDDEMDKLEVMLRDLEDVMRFGCWPWGEAHLKRMVEDKWNSIARKIER